LEKTRQNVVFSLDTARNLQNRALLRHLAQIIDHLCDGLDVVQVLTHGCLLAEGDHESEHFGAVGGSLLLQRLRHKLSEDQFGKEESRPLVLFEVV
jgi:hypothetical protein